MIGGNIVLQLQYKAFDETVTNELGEQELGEQEPVWLDYIKLTGWLDLSTGSAQYNNYNAKLTESSNIFICDYVKIDKSEKELRAICDGAMYDVTYIDDPMGLHQQIEIYLKRVE